MLDLTIVPDYMPDQFTAWYMLNTYLQKELHEGITLRLPESFADLEEEERVHGMPAMIYVNPFGAERYVREHGYLPLVQPRNVSDEVVIIAPSESDYHKVEDLKAPLRLAISHNQDANFIGMRLLEPAGLDEAEVTLVEKDNSLMVASAVARGRADAGIMASASYQQMTDISLSQIRALLESKINDVRHVWLYRPDKEEEVAPLLPLLLNLTDNDEGQAIAKGLGLPEGFDPLDEEQLEFMIDLVDTLRD